jgi:hypothetical protein
MDIRSGHDGDGSDPWCDCFTRRFEGVVTVVSNPQGVADLGKAVGPCPSSADGRPEGTTFVLCPECYAAAVERSGRVHRVFETNSYRWSLLTPQDMGRKRESNGR